MDDERKYVLENDPNSVLTGKELSEGWHFCPDWDGILVGPGTPEKESCLCDE